MPNTTKAKTCKTSQIKIYFARRKNFRISGRQRRNDVTGAVTSACVRSSTQTSRCSIVDCQSQRLADATQHCVTLSLKLRPPNPVAVSTGKAQRLAGLFCLLCACVCVCVGGSSYRMQCQVCARQCELTRWERYGCARPRSLRFCQHTCYFLRGCCCCCCLLAQGNYVGCGVLSQRSPAFSFCDDEFRSFVIYPVCACVLHIPPISLSE